MKDRGYQQRTQDNIRDSIRRGHRRILVVEPTGAGKGYVSARIMQQAFLKNNPSVFFADQRELVRQLGDQLDRLQCPYETILSGVKNEYQSAAEANAATLARVISKDTLWARVFRSERMELPPAIIVQMDEAHRSLARTWQKIAQAYCEAIVIGWTATPCRTDGRGLGDFYTDMVIGATYKELQALGFLVPVKIWAPDRPDLKGLKSSKGDYVKGALEERMNQERLVGNIIEEWKKRAEHRQTVCFASGIKHSIHIRNQFIRLGIKAEHLDGTLENNEREDILGRVRDGITTVLCNYGVATTGVDIPAWKYMVNARPTKSFGLWRQMAGRIQRPYEGHTHCMIQDHSDCAMRFGYPDEDVEWTLDTTEKIQEAHEKKQQEKKVKDPYCCDKCKCVYRGPHCPECGHRPERAGKEVKMSKGELKELERAKANKQATHQDKQKFWDECLGWAIGTNCKVGAAAHRYKQRFGVFPNSQLECVPRSSQWQMTAKDFYIKVVKPHKAQAVA